MHPQAAIHQASLLSVDKAKGEAFWLNAAKTIDWVKFPTKAWGPTKSSAEGAWFPDGTLNTCYNALDRHVLAGNGDRVAFRYVSVMDPNQPYRAMTYKEVLEEVKVLSGVLKEKFKVKKGDRVIIYM
jgi:propionyl-CoA synthetase